MIELLPVALAVVVVPSLARSRMTSEVGPVALYAILLREAGNEHHLNREAHLDDIECCRSELSMATLAAGAQFTELDWELAALLYEGEKARIFETARLLIANDEPVTAEALLHAHDKRPRAQWAQDIARRWDRVRSAIAPFEDEGLAIPSSVTSI
jgi:hypothetical protein